MAPPTRPIRDRLLEKKTIDGNGCWIWSGPYDKDGYGLIGIRRTGSKRAHRVSYATFVGSIPAGKMICHRCDVPSCINPEHLFVGTAKDNTSDCWKKGRNRPALQGADHPMAKLSDMDVWKIRKLRQIGLEYAQIGRYFGDMKFQNIHMICKGKTWKHVDMEAMRQQFLATSQWGTR